MDSSGNKIRPDIIVHHSGFCEPEHNLLAIEIKKKDQPETDFAKLRDYTNPATDNKKYQYQFGLGLEFKDLRPKYKWFVDGKDFEGI